MDQRTPEGVYEHRWALTVLRRAMEQFEKEWAEGRRYEQFEKLKPHLTGQEPRIPYRELASDLSLSERRPVDVGGPTTCTQIPVETTDPSDQHPGSNRSSTPRSKRTSTVF